MTINENQWKSFKSLSIAALIFIAFQYQESLVLPEGNLIDCYGLYCKYCFPLRELLSAWKGKFVSPEGIVVAWKGKFASPKGIHPKNITIQECLVGCQILFADHLELLNCSRTKHRPAAMMATCRWSFRDQSSVWTFNTPKTHYTRKHWAYHLNALPNYTQKMTRKHDKSYLLSQVARVFTLHCSRETTRQTSQNVLLSIVFRRGNRVFTETQKVKSFPFIDKGDKTGLRKNNISE